jgi:hypothetical protein
VAFTGEPVPAVLLPKLQLSVPTPVPVKVHVAPLHEPEVILAGVVGWATVAGPAVDVVPHPRLLQARTA